MMDGFNPKLFPSGLAGGADPSSLEAAGRVLFPLQPFDDESLLGFIARTASWNFIDDVRALLRLAGIVWVKTDPSPQMMGRSAELATCLGVAENEVRIRLHEGDPKPSALATYYGEALRRHTLDLKCRRVSPASLRRSAHYRATWEVRALTFCPQSWEILVDRCPSCMTKLMWASTCEVDRCDRCGFDLKGALAPTVKPAHRDVLSILAAFVHPSKPLREQAKSHLPPVLQRFNAIALFELALAFSRALLPPKSNVTVSKRLASMAEAMRLMLDFPRGFEEIAARSREDNTTRALFFIRLAGATSFNFDPDLLSFIHEVIRSYDLHEHGPSRLKKLREDRGKLTIREVAIKLRIENSDVQRLINLGAFQASAARGRYRCSRWFDPLDVEEVGARLRNRMSAVRLEREFGLPFAAIEQLVSFGEISITDDLVVRGFYSGLQLRQDSVERFLDRARSQLWLPRPQVPATTLAELLQGVGGMEKPWGALIKAFLDEKLPGGLAAEPGEPLKFDHLLVSPAFAADFLAGGDAKFKELPPRSAELGPLPDFTRIETERYLNCYPRDVSWLLINGHLSARRGGARRFPRPVVERLGSSLISSREIMRRWRISSSYREGLAELGIRRVLGPFWSRIEITEHLATRFTAGRPV